jgi:acetolactate synthase-1/2/3 large subunit
MSTQSNTAGDTLHQKNKDGTVISVGLLVAKALKVECVDTVFTPCGA